MQKSFLLYIVNKQELHIAISTLSKPQRQFCLRVSLPSSSSPKKRLKKGLNLDNHHFETRFLHRCTWSHEGSYIHCLKYSVGHFIAHPTITALLSATDRGERAQNALTNLALAKGTRCIDLQPLIHALLVEKMRTWQLSQLIIVCVFCQADATNLFNFTTLLVIPSIIAGRRLPKIRRKRETLCKEKNT